MEQYKKNDIIVVSVEDMGADGEGSGKINGFPFFIKDEKYEIVLLNMLEAI